MNIKSHKLFPRQAEIAKGILESEKLVSVLCTSRQFGKSNLIQTLAVYYAINTPKTTVAYFTPYYGLAIEILEQIDSWLSPFKIHKTNKSKKEIKFRNGSRIRFFSTEKPKGIRGFPITYVIVDEASFISEDAFASAIAPTMTVQGKKMIICSTPLTKSSWFYREFSNNLNDVHWANYLSNPFTNLAVIEDQKAKIPAWRFKCEYLGQFVDSDLAVFDNIDVVCSLNPSTSKDKTYAGLDIGLKNDFTVFTIMDRNGDVIQMIRFTGVSPELLVNKITEAIKTYNVGTIIAEENFESTIIDLIRRANKGVYIEGFRTSNKTKIEIIEALIVAFDYKQVKHLNLPEVIDEFSSFIKVDLPTGYTYRAEKNKHDDIVMSTALAYYCYKSYFRSSPVKFINI